MGRFVIIKSGGHLEFVSWGPGRPIDDEDYRRSDVTTDAAAYLMDEVRLDADIYLRDIVSLLELNPTLIQLFEHVGASEFLAASKRAEADPCNAEGIEYLVLTPIWCKTSVELLIVSHRLAISGVSSVLRPEDLEMEGDMWAKEIGIQMPLWDYPLVQLLNLRLCFKGRRPFWQGASVRKGRRRELVTSVELVPSLAQIIHGVLRELTGGGDPDLEYPDELA